MYIYIYIYGYIYIYIYIHTYIHTYNQIHVKCSALDTCACELRSPRGALRGGQGTVD